MSLLNKVLKKVEQQRQNITGSDKQVPSPNNNADSPAKKKSVLSGRLALWLIFFLIVLIGAYLVFQKEKAIKSMLSLRQTSKPVAFVKEKVPELPKISNIQWHAIGARHARLQIQLTQHAHFILSRNPADHVMTITLKKVTLPKEITLPTLENKSIASSLQATEKDNTVQFTLTTTPNVKIHTIEHTTQEGAVLSVELTAPQQPQPNPDDVKEIKLTPAQQLEKNYESALTLAQEGNLKQATEAMTQLAKAHPETPKLQMAVAQLWYDQHHYTEADQAADALLKAHPDSLSAVVLKAHIAIAQKQWQKAKALLSNYSPNILNHEAFYDLLATSELMTGHYEDASGYYLQLLNLKPNHSAWWLGYALAQENLGNLHSARTAYERALQNGQLAPPLQVFVYKQLKGLKN